MSEDPSNIIPLFGSEQIEEPPPPPDEPDEQESGPLPADFPIRVLGKYEGIYHYLTDRGEIVSLAGEKHGQANLAMLVGGRTVELLEPHWPRKTEKITKDKDGNIVSREWLITGWRPEKFRDALFQVAEALPPWSPRGKVRGRGAWRSLDGKLVLNLGDRLVIVPEMPPETAGTSNFVEAAPGQVEEFVYPTGPAMPRPHHLYQPGGEQGPAVKYRGYLETLNWRRPELDPHLMLGWTGAAMIGGATRWRPMAWLTGDSYSGKSTIQNALKDICGMLVSPNTTEAGVRQTLKHDTLPIGIDEGEPDEGSTLAKLVKMSRDMATGAEAWRGGSDHTASNFELRSNVLFSSILIPSMSPQDSNRICIFELIAPPEGDTPWPKTPQLRELGAKLLRRLCDQWHRWEDTFDCYRRGLADLGHNPRAQDVYGTMLAAADLLLHDGEPIDETIQFWARKLPLKSESTASANHIECRDHLLGWTLEKISTRDRRKVGEWLVTANNDKDPDHQIGAERVLAQIGLQIKLYEGKRWLAVSNSDQGLLQVFKDTVWAGMPGKSSPWVQALRRFPHKVPAGTTSIGGVNRRVTLIELEPCLPIAENRDSELQSVTREGKIGA